MTDNPAPTPPHIRLESATGHPASALLELLAEYLEPTDVVWCVNARARVDLGGTGARVLWLRLEGDALVSDEPLGAGETTPSTPTVVVLVDVLNRAADPVATLGALHAAAPGAHLFVAEPRAFAGHGLDAPERRHYSELGLRQTLIRGGYQAEHWLVDNSFTGGLSRWLPNEVAEPFRLAHAAHPEAERALGQLREHPDPELRAEALVRAAERHLDSGRGDPAAECYLAALSEWPEHAPALAGLARLALLGQDVARATELASRAFQLDPASVQAATAMASCLERMCPEASIEAWRHAAMLAPADSAVVTAYARAAAEAGNGEAAIAAMEQLLEYGAQGADFHVTLAWLLLRESRSGDASVEAEVARAIDPHHPMLADLHALMQG